MRRSCAAALLVAAALAGCGGGSSAHPATTAAEPAATRTVAPPPTLGCDVVVVCVPQVAHDTLERCPASRLGPEGRHARRRLEKALAEIEGVDLHNRQVDEVSAAAALALSELERACARTR